MERRDPDSALIWGCGQGPCVGPRRKPEKLGSLRGCPPARQTGLTSTLTPLKTELQGGRVPTGALDG